MYRFAKKLPLFLICFSFIIACQDTRDPQQPEGALKLFGLALEQGDQALIKASLSAKTSTILNDILKTTQAINKKIETYPDAEAQSWARGEALGSFLSQLKFPSDETKLWNLLVGEKLKWAKSQAPGTVEQGVSIRRVLSGSQNESEMTILTRSDNPISLRKEGLRWVITSFEEPLQKVKVHLNDSLKILEPNRKEWIRRQKLNLNLPKSSGRTK